MTTGSDTLAGMPVVQADAPGPSPRGRSILDGLRSMLRMPPPGKRPAGLYVTHRGWCRNSALVMSLYETGGGRR